MKKLLVTAACILTFAAGADGQTDKNDNTNEYHEMIALTKLTFWKSRQLQKPIHRVEIPRRQTALVDFYASWCGLQSPRTRAGGTAAEYGDSIYIYKINTEEEQELAAAFGIRSIPTLLFIPKDGKPQMAQAPCPGFAERGDRQGAPQ